MPVRHFEIGEGSPSKLRSIRRFEGTVRAGRDVVEVRPRDASDDNTLLLRLTEGKE